VGGCRKTRAPLHRRCRPRSEASCASPSRRAPCPSPPRARTPARPPRPPKELRRCPALSADALHVNACCGSSGRPCRGIRQREPTLSRAHTTSYGTCAHGSSTACVSTPAPPHVSPEPSQPLHGPPATTTRCPLQRHRSKSSRPNAGTATPPRREATHHSRSRWPSRTCGDTASCQKALRRQLLPTPRPSACAAPRHISAPPQRSTHNGSPDGLAGTANSSSPQRGPADYASTAGPNRAKDLG